MSKIDETKEILAALGLARKQQNDRSARVLLAMADIRSETFLQYASDIAWETEVWIADNPAHMIHFNGEKFLQPIP